MIDVQDKPLQHNEDQWCRMLSARYALSPLVVSSLLDELDEQAARAGAPLERTRTARWRHDGERIGDDRRISNEAGCFLAYACEQVRDAIEKSVSNMLGAVQ